MQPRKKIIIVHNHNRRHKSEPTPENKVTSTNDGIVFLVIALVIAVGIAAFLGGQRQQRLGLYTTGTEYEYTPPNGTLNVHDDEGR